MDLWQGVNWTFVVWGLWHAILVLGYRLCEPFRTRVPEKLWPVFGWLSMFPLVMLGWLFFRVTNLNDGLTMLGRALDPSFIRTMSLRENVYLVTFMCTSGMLWYAGALRVGRMSLMPV